MDRFKARLVAKGFHQQAGIDFSETFSLVVKPVTVRLLLSLAVTRGWTMRQLDVQNAFLHGLLSEDVFMNQPPGFVHPDFPHFVCKLNRSLYGLKQAPRAWFSRLSECLLQLGFLASRSDPSLFICHSSHCHLYVLIYVDDIIVTGSSDLAITDLIHTLQSYFPIKDLGHLHYFLGIEICPISTGIILSQKRYIFDLLQRSQMLHANPVSTPMAVNCKLDHTGPPFSDPTLFRSIVGGLQYLSFTRPDLSFAVNKVC